MEVAVWGLGVRGLRARVGGLGFGVGGRGWRLEAGGFVFCVLCSGSWILGLGGLGFGGGWICLGLGFGVWLHPHVQPWCFSLRRHRVLGSLVMVSTKYQCLGDVLGCVKDFGVRESSASPEW